MSISETKTAARTMEARARRLAQVYLDAAKTGGNVDVLAATAELVIKIAEKRATLIPVEEVGRERAELKAWSSDETARIVSTVEQRQATGEDLSLGQIEAALAAEVAPTLAALDRRREALGLSLARRDLDAWVEATERLVALNSPATLSDAPTSAARH